MALEIRKIRIGEIEHYKTKGYEILVLAKKKVNIDDFIIDTKSASDVKYDMEVAHIRAKNVDPRDNEPPAIDSDNISSRFEPPRIKFHFNPGAKGAAALLMLCAIRYGMSLTEKEIVDIIKDKNWRGDKPTQNPYERYQKAKKFVDRYEIVFSTELISPSKKRKRKSADQNSAYLLRQDISKRLPNKIREYLEDAQQSVEDLER